MERGQYNGIYQGNLSMFPYIYFVAFNFIFLIAKKFYEKYVNKETLLKEIYQRLFSRVLNKNVYLKKWIVLNILLNHFL